MKFELEDREWEDRGNYRVMKVFDIADDSFVQIVEIRGRVGKHYHLNQTEVFTIMDGGGRLGIGDEVWDVKPGDVFLCRPKSVHFVESDFVRILVFKYGWKPDDTVWLE